MNRLTLSLVFSLTILLNLAQPSNAHAMSCEERGCYCSSGEVLPNDCYDDSKGRCCPGEPRDTPPTALESFSQQLENIERTAQTSLATTQTEVANLCVDMGCFCGSANKGNIIPIACYSDTQKCCPGEAPEHIKERFEELKNSQSPQLDPVFGQVVNFSECSRHDGDETVVVCNDGLYQKVRGDDPNSLPLNLQRHINNTSSTKDREITGSARDDSRGRGVSVQE